jgi:autotransporter translocation and assembly factor TamB
LNLKPLFAIVLRRYFVVALMLLLLIGGAFYALKQYRTELVTLALAKAVEVSQGKLTISEPKASAIGGVEVDSLRWKDASSQIDIDRLQIDPSISIQALLGRRLNISDLRAERVTVTFAPSNEAFVAPKTLTCQFLLH